MHVLSEIWYPTRDPTTLWWVVFSKTLFVIIISIVVV